MRILVCLVLIFVVVFCAGAYAQVSPTLSEKVVGMTFRAVMRVCIMASDIDKLRKNNAVKVNEMSDEDFIAKRARVYDLVKDLPESIKKDYAISPDITRQEVVKGIEKLDKKRLYTIIDALPDQALARMFKKARGKKAATSGPDEANSFWESMADRISNP